MIIIFINIIMNAYCFFRDLESVFFCISYKRNCHLIKVIKLLLNIKFYNKFFEKLFYYKFFINYKKKIQFYIIKTTNFILCKNLNH
jgi:hypothetical protein